MAQRVDPAVDLGNATFADFEGQDRVGLVGKFEQRRQRRFRRRAALNSQKGAQPGDDARKERAAPMICFVA
ncbi:hypothetical protein RSO01_11590 [Reyranella soli]|uniref:Uncharacterized protein n=1 Tax=Reyranella soli TaxID=1230389 RepID=A0A512N4X4_9HYPH|nr:hypothetical protein RSO01_11590 [Reyranella soli]